MKFSFTKSPFSRLSFLSNTVSRSFQTQPAHLTHQFVQASATTPYNLVVLHGLLGSSNNFRSIVSNPSIKSKINSYLLDLRNHGASEHKPSMEIREMAGDVVHFIKEKNLKNLVLIGHSLGGKVLMSMATDYPDIHSFVKSVVIMDIAPVNYYKDPTQKHSSTLDNLSMLTKLNSIVMEGKPYNDLRKEIFKNCPSKEIGELIWTNVLHDNKQNKHKWRINLSAIVQYYPKFIEYVPTNTQKCYSGIIKIMRGAKSDYIKDEYLKNFKEIFKTLNLTNDVITIKDAGHWIHFEKPYDVIKELSGIIDLAKAENK